MKALVVQADAAAHHALNRSRAVRWSIGIGIAAMTAIGLVLLFVLAQATTNRAMYGQN